MSKNRNQEKSESGYLIDVYIVKAMVLKGVPIQCKKCGSKKCLTLQHKKYFSHTIDDMELLCWKCHSKTDIGTAWEAPKHWKGIELKTHDDGKQYVHLRTYYFEC